LLILPHLKKEVCKYTFYIVWKKRHFNHAICLHNTFLLVQYYLATQFAIKYLHFLHL
jgi:hypothetical protein